MTVGSRLVNCNVRSAIGKRCNEDGALSFVTDPVFVDLAVAIVVLAIACCLDRLGAGDGGVVGLDERAGLGITDAQQIRRKDSAAGQAGRRRLADAGLAFAFALSFPFALPFSFLPA
jgi:hypothetical protein